MTTARLTRLGGLANLAAAFFIILARVDQLLLFPGQPLRIYSHNGWFIPLVGIPNILGTALLLAGVAAIYAIQSRQAGWSGVIGFTLGFFGVSLLLSGNWALTYVAPYISDINPLLLDASFRDPAWGQLGQGFREAHVLGTAGYMIFALSVLRVGVLPSWAGIIMLICMPLAMVLPIDPISPWAILQNALMAAGAIASGVAMWQMGE